MGLPPDVVRDLYVLRGLSEWFSELYDCVDSSTELNLKLLTVPSGTLRSPKQSAIGILFSEKTGGCVGIFSVTSTAIRPNPYWLNGSVCVHWSVHPTGSFLKGHCIVYIWACTR